MVVRCDGAKGGVDVSRICRVRVYTLLPPLQPLHPNSPPTAAATASSSSSLSWAARAQAGVLSTAVPSAGALLPGGARKVRERSAWGDGEEGKKGWRVGGSVVELFLFFFRSLQFHIFYFIFFYFFNSYLFI